MKKFDEKILLELKTLNAKRTQGDWMPSDEQYAAILAKDIENDGEQWIHGGGLINSSSYYNLIPENEVIDGLRTYGHRWYNNFICDMNDGEYHEYINFEEQKANADFIIASSKYMGLLLDEIERLRLNNK